MAPLPWPFLVLVAGEGLPSALRASVALAAIRDSTIRYGPDAQCELAADTMVKSGLSHVESPEASAGVSIGLEGQGGCT